MLRTILTYGLVAGLILMPFELILAFGHVAGSHSMLVGYTVMLVALSTVFLGVKRRRDVAGGGVIGFWPALGVGLAISLVAGVIYVAVWDISLKASGMDFIGDYARAVLAGMKAKGASPEKLAKAAADMERMKAEYANPLYRWPMTFMEIAPVGLLVSLVSAGLLRNPRFLPARTS